MIYLKNKVNSFMIETIIDQYLKILRDLFMRCLLPLLILFGPVLARAEQPPSLNAVPEPPELPLPVQSGETMEPDITIIRRGEKTITEYRVNGELYKIKITPDIGPAYYLIDSNGDGNLDVRETGLDKDLNVPQWVLFRW